MGQESPKFSSTAAPSMSATTAIPAPNLAWITALYVRYHEYFGTREGYVTELHRQYGPIVRVGPNDISINDVEGMRDLFAVTKRLDRSETLYGFHLYRSPNLTSTVDGELHVERKKPLRANFTNKVVEADDMQSMIRQSVARLIRYIEVKNAECGRLDMILPLRYMVCDIMSEIVYGKRYKLNLLEDEKQCKDMHVDICWSEKRLANMMYYVETYAPGLLRLLRKIPFAPASIVRSTPSHLYMDKLGRAALADLKSQAQTSDSQDESSILSKVYSNFITNGPSAACPDENYVLSEAMDHLYAGVSTTGDTLVNVLFELSLPQHQQYQKLLREELSSLPSIPTPSDLQNLLWLNAIINETMRLQPAIPRVNERQIPSREGPMVVKGHVLPVGTRVGMQPYTMHRHPDVFPDAETWRPERWIAGLPRTDLDFEPATEKAQVVYDGKDEGTAELERLREMKNHLCTFSAGPRMCIGMNLAWSMLRITLTEIFRTYDTTLPQEIVNDQFKEGDWEFMKVKEEFRENAKKLWPWARDAPLQFRRV